MALPVKRNIRSVADAKERFDERYGAGQNQATVALERDVIGGDYGANGYTTRVQADVLLDRLELTRASASSTSAPAVAGRASISPSAAVAGWCSRTCRSSR